MAKLWAIVPHDNYIDAGTQPIQVVDGEGNTVACNTTYYPTAITAEHAATIVAAVNSAGALEEVATLLSPDPYDERSGPWFSNADLKGLNSLPSGTKLFIQSQEAAGVPAVA